MTKFTLDNFDHEFDSAKFYPGNVEALIERAVKHIINNECDSAALAELVKEYFVANGGDKAKGDEAKVLRTAARRKVKELLDAEEPATVARKAEFKLAAQNEKATALYESELGVSTRGPKLSPFDAMVASLAKRDLIAVLKNMDAEVTDATGVKSVRKLWSGKADPKPETIIYGERTFEDMLAGFTKKNEADLHKRAQAELDRQAREAAKAAEKAAKASVGIDF